MMYVWIMSGNPDYPNYCDAIAIASTLEGAKMSATHLMTNKKSTIKWEEMTPDIHDGLITNYWPAGPAQIHVRVSKERVDEFSWDMYPEKEALTNE